MKRKRNVELLRNVHIAAPCSVSWDSMTGDEKSRQCGQCAKRVYDLSAMTTKEAELFLTQSQGRDCLRFYRRQDGTIMTDNCPVGLRKLRNHCRNALKGVCAVAALMISIPAAFSQGTGFNPTVKKLTAAGFQGMPANHIKMVSHIDMSTPFPDDNSSSQTTDKTKLKSLKADPNAFYLHEQGESSEAQGKLFMAAAFYQSALTHITQNADSNFDPKFQEIVASNLSRVQSQLAQPESIA